MVDEERVMSKKENPEVPLWHRQNLSVFETSAYTGLGTSVIYYLANQDDGNFTFRVGQKLMIRRKRFEDYLETLFSIQEVRNA